jgi:hypothetical protein
VWKEADEKQRGEGHTGMKEEFCPSPLLLSLCVCVCTCIYADYIGYVVDSNGGWLERSKTDSFPPPNEKEENITQMDKARIHILRLYVCRKKVVVVVVVVVGRFTFGGEETRNRIGARYTRAKKPSSRSM